VIIKKGHPLILPPWKRVFDNTTFINSYVPFDWSKQPLLSDATLSPSASREVPLYQGSNGQNFPLAYPRCYRESDDLITGSLFTLLQSNNIFPFQPSGAAGFFFTDGLEINGKDTVLDNDGNPHVMPSTLNDRWQGGDALLMNVITLGPSENPAEVFWYTEIGNTFPTPPLAVEQTAMMSHDQDVVNSVISAFNNVAFMYFFQRKDTPTGTDFLQEAADAVSTILENGVAGIANAEYHRTQTLADTIVLAEAKAHSFFGV
jgi:hypothetical protein